MSTVQYRTVNPPANQIILLRIIDREGMIDDVILHER